VVEGQDIWRTACKPRHQSSMQASASIEHASLGINHVPQSKHCAQTPPRQTVAAAF